MTRHMCSWNSSSCSTDMATTEFFSFPSVMRFTVGLSGSEFLVNCLSRPRCMRISNSSFRWMQSSVTCPWHFWNRHHLVLSIPFFSCEAGFGGLTPASFSSATEILAKIFSLEIDKGVYYVKRPPGPLPSRVTLSSFFLSWKGFLEDSTTGFSFLILLRLSA